MTNQTKDRTAAANMNCAVHKNAPILCNLNMI